jgi:integron integrase
MSEFIEQVRQEMRVRRYSLKTEKAYLGWIKQFIWFHELKHPQDMKNLEIEAFLNHLANHRKVSSSTQTQALCALIFLYKYVLNIGIEDLKYGFSKKEKRLPTVISANEANHIVNLLSFKYRLICLLLYGAGLRISEALQLRIKDINYTNNTLFVFKGKGAKDRYTLLPEKVVPDLKKQITHSIKLHKKDTNEGYGLTSLPASLLKKYKTAAQDTSWQYIFPSSVRCHHPTDGYMCRHHLHESSFRKNLREAVKQSGINKRVTAHTFRHTFATLLLMNGTDIRTLQELLGHSDIRTTEIYTHVMGAKFAGTKSPVDF